MAVTYGGVRSDIQAQQQKVLEQQRLSQKALAELKKQPSIPQQIAMRQQMQKQPGYRVAVMQQKAKIPEEIKKIVDYQKILEEAGTDLPKQLETIEKYEKEGYTIAGTPEEGYQFTKVIPATYTTRTGTTSVSFTTSSPQLSSLKTQKANLEKMRDRIQNSRALSRSAFGQKQLANLENRIASLDIQIRGLENKPKSIFTLMRENPGVKLSDLVKLHMTEIRDIQKIVQDVKSQSISKSIIQTEKLLTGAGITQQSFAKLGGQITIDGNIIKGTDYKDLVQKVAEYSISKDASTYARGLYGLGPTYVSSSIKDSDIPPDVVYLSKAGVLNINAYRNELGKQIFNQYIGKTPNYDKLNKMIENAYERLPPTPRTGKETLKVETQETKDIRGAYSYGGILNPVGKIAGAIWEGARSTFFPEMGYKKIPDTTFAGVTHGYSQDEFAGRFTDWDKIPIVERKNYPGGTWYFAHAGEKYEVTDEKGNKVLKQIPTQSQLIEEGKNFIKAREGVSQLYEDTGEWFMTPFGMPYPTEPEKAKAKFGMVATVADIKPEKKQAEDTWIWQNLTAQPAEVKKFYYEQKPTLFKIVDTYATTIGKAATAMITFPEWVAEQIGGRIYTGATSLGKTWEPVDLGKTNIPIVKQWGSLSERAQEYWTKRDIGQTPGLIEATTGKILGSSEYKPEAPTFTKYKESYTKDYQRRISDWEQRNKQGTQPYKLSESELKVNYDQEYKVPVESWERVIKNPFEAVIGTGGEIAGFWLGGKAMGLARTGASQYVFKPMVQGIKYPTISIGSKLVKPLYAGTSKLWTTTKKLTTKTKELVGIEAPEGAITRVTTRPGFVKTLEGISTRPTMQRISQWGKTGAPSKLSWEQSWVGLKPIAARIPSVYGKVKSTFTKPITVTSGVGRYASYVPEGTGTVMRGAAKAIEVGRRTPRLFTSLEKVSGWKYLKPGLTNLYAWGKGKYTIQPIGLTPKAIFQRVLRPRRPIEESHQITPEGQVVSTPQAASVEEMIRLADESKLGTGEITFGHSTTGPLGKNVLVQTHPGPYSVMKRDIPIKEPVVSTKVMIEKGVSELPVKVEQMSNYYLKGFGAKLTALKGNIEMYAKGWVEKTKVIEMLNKTTNEFRKLPIDKIKGKADFKEIQKISEKITTLEKEVNNILITPKNKINLTKFKNTINEINNLGHEYRSRLESYTTKLRESPGYETLPGVTKLSPVEYTKALSSWKQKGLTEIEGISAKIKKYEKMVKEGIVDEDIKMMTKDASGHYVEVKGNLAKDIPKEITRLKNLKSSLEETTVSQQIPKIETIVKTKLDKVALDIIKENDLAVGGGRALTLQTGVKRTLRDWDTINSGSISETAQKATNVAKSFTEKTGIEYTIHPGREPGIYTIYQKGTRVKDTAIMDIVSSEAKGKRLFAENLGFAKVGDVTVLDLETLKSNLLDMLQTGKDTRKTITDISSLSGLTPKEIIDYMGGPYAGIVERLPYPRSPNILIKKTVLQTGDIVEDKVTKAFIEAGKRNKLALGGSGSLKLNAKMSVEYLKFEPGDLDWLSEAPLKSTPKQTSFLQQVRNYAQDVERYGGKSGAKIKKLGHEGSYRVTYEGQSVDITSIHAPRIGEKQVYQPWLEKIPTVKSEGLLIADPQYIFERYLMMSKYGIMRRFKRIGGQIVKVDRLGATLRKLKISTKQSREGLRQFEPEYPPGSGRVLKEKFSLRQRLGLWPEETVIGRSVRLTPEGVEPPVLYVAAKGKRPPGGATPAGYHTWMFEGGKRYKTTLLARPKQAAIVEFGAEGIKRVKGGAKDTFEWIDKVYEEPASRSVWVTPRAEILGGGAIESEAALLTGHGLRKQPLGVGMRPPIPKPTTTIGKVVYGAKVVGRKYYEMIAKITGISDFEILPGGKIVVFRGHRMLLPDEVTTINRAINKAKTGDATELSELLGARLSPDGKQFITSEGVALDVKSVSKTLKPGKEVTKAEYTKIQRQVEEQVKREVPRPIIHERQVGRAEALERLGRYGEEREVPSYALTYTRPRYERPPLERTTPEYTPRYETTERPGREGGREYGYYKEGYYGRGYPRTSAPRPSPPVGLLPEIEKQKDISLKAKPFFKGYKERFYDVPFVETAVARGGAFARTQQPIAKKPKFFSLIKK